MLPPSFVPGQNLRGQPRQILQGGRVQQMTPQGLVPQQQIQEKKWIQKAINPEHEGYCTPMSKSTCTPRRKALAKRFKKGGDLHK